MLRTVVILLALLLPSTAQAYIGPGAGISAIGTLLALIAAVLVAIVGFVWYPVRRMMRNRRKAREVADGAEVKDEKALP